MTAASLMSAVLTVVSRRSAEVTLPSVIIELVTELDWASLTYRPSLYDRSSLTLPADVIGLGTQMMPVSW